MRITIKNYSYLFEPYYVRLPERGLIAAQVHEGKWKFNNEIDKANFWLAMMKGREIKEHRKRARIMRSLRRKVNYTLHDNFGIEQQVSIAALAWMTVMALGIVLLIVGFLIYK